MLFSEQKLFGNCDVEIYGILQARETACVLDLDSGRMEIQFDISSSSDQNDQDPDDSLILRNLKLQTPLGIATAKTVGNTLIISEKHGGMWVGTTDLSYLFEEKNKHIPRITLVFNSPLVFDWPCEKTETIVTPGMDLYGEVEVEGICRINGGKETLSILDFQGDQRYLLAGISLAVGAPVRILAKTENQCLTLYLSRRRTDIEVRPMFYSGFPWVKLDLMRSGVVDVIEKTISHLKSQNNEGRVGFINAVDSFLEGKSIKAGLPIKLLAAIHFLEWFDGSKTFSKNQLVKRLGITQGDAAAVVELRNELIHNRKYLADVVAETHEKLCKENSDRFKMMRSSNPEITVLNYLYSICGAALLAEIGYEAVAQDYIPTEKDH